MRLRYRQPGIVDCQRRLPGNRYRAFTFFDLMLTVAILSLTSMIAVPLFTQQVDKAKVAKAIGDIGRVQIIIDRYDLNLRAIPLTLATVGMGGMVDPWGHPYQYLSLQNCDGDKCLNPANQTVKARRDGKLKPINSYYDLYSLGKDGDSKQSLTANVSQDDIVRAQDGAFIGLASKYSPK